MSMPVFRNISQRFGGIFNQNNLGFNRFHNEDSCVNGKSNFNETTELSNLPNGKSSYTEDATEATGATEGWPDGGYSGILAVEEEEVDKKKKRNRISSWQAGWNVTNAIQGMFIVTFPYTVVEGGYWALFAMVIVAYICCYTGKILVDCLYEENASGVPERVRNSYVEIAEDVWGKQIGGRIVNAAQMIELLMTCILYVLLCGNLMIGILPNTPLDLSSWILISSTMLLPCAFLKSLRHVSWLSFWCTVAHMFINAIIIIYCFRNVNEWKWDQVQIKIDIWTFPISLGIVIFSYTSQIFLPTLEGNLTDRSKFSAMMHWTHIAAAIFKVAFSWIGFLAFGMATKEFITNNLENQTLKVVVNLFLVAKSLLSYPLPYYAAVEVLESTFFKGRPATVLPSCYNADDKLKVWSLFLRLLLVGFTIGMAIIIPHFNILMGLIGSFTGNMLSLVWPCYFHLKIKGYSMTRVEKLWDILIIVVGVICSILGVYYSTHALVMAFKGIDPQPFHNLPVEESPNSIKVIQNVQDKSINWLSNSTLIPFT